MNSLECGAVFDKEAQKNCNLSAQNQMQMFELNFNAHVSIVIFIYDEFTSHQVHVQTYSTQNKHKAGQFAGNMYKNRLGCNDSYHVPATLK